MPLVAPDATPLDLRFRLFGVEVRVHPLFWLMAVILGFNSMQDKSLDQAGFLPLFIWIAAVFFSILLHEFGHIWMGQAFGSHGHIVLHGMGGLAIGASQVDASWKRILVIAAGPLIQLLLFVVLVALILSGTVGLPERMFAPLWDLFRWLAGPERFLQLLAAGPANPAGSILLQNLLSINLLWPILNLLPIYPLDGGQITREVATLARPRDGAINALWLSLIVSAALAINALIGANGGNPFIPYAPTGMYLTILFAFLAVGNWQMIQQERAAQRESYGGYESDDRLPWER